MFSIVICHLRWHSTKIIEEPYSFNFFSKRKKNCSFSFLISTFAAEFGEQIFEVCATQKYLKICERESGENPVQYPLL